jgi:hypothetical protein
MAQSGEFDGDIIVPSRPIRGPSRAWSSEVGDLLRFSVGRYRRCTAGGNDGVIRNGAARLRQTGSASRLRFKEAWIGYLDRWTLKQQLGLCGSCRHDANGK